MKLLFLGLHDFNSKASAILQSFGSLKHDDKMLKSFKVTGT